MNTFDSLKLNIASWLRRTDLDDIIDSLVALGERRIARDCKDFLRGMEADLSETISSGEVALPTGYVGLKHAYIDGSPTQALERKSAKWIYKYYPTRSADGKPVYIARENDAFIFGPYPDSNYTVKGVYLKTITSLSESNQTNWLTDNVPELLLYACLVETQGYSKNPQGMALWENKYQDLVDELRMNYEGEDWSGSTLTQTPS